MPSTASVQTTIAPSIAVLVRSGMIAIAVGGSPGTRRRDEPKPASQGRPTVRRRRAPPSPTVSAGGQGAVHPDADVDGCRRARAGTACPAASRATISTLVRPVIRLSSSQTAWAVASAVPRASR